MFEDLAKVLKTLSLQPLIQWPGGKNKVANRIVRMLPPHSTYVEPFAGGAAVFFRKPLVKRNVIGDADPWLIELYNGVRNGGLSKCSVGIKKSRGAFEKAKKNQRSVCSKVALANMSFHGDRKGYALANKGPEGMKIGFTRLSKHKAYKKKLRKSYVRLSDFAQTMRKFDGPETVHFLDPPWLLDYSDKFYYGGTKAKLEGNRGTKKKGTAFDPEHLKKVADRMQGYVFIIINNHPKLRKLFCKSKGWKCKYMLNPLNKDHRNAKERQLVIIKDFGRYKPKRKTKR